MTPRSRTGSTIGLIEQDMKSLESLWRPGVIKVLIALALHGQMYAFAVQQNEQREERSQISIRVCDPASLEEEIVTVGTFGAHVVCGRAPSNLRGRSGVSVAVTDPRGATVDVAMITSRVRCDRLGVWR